MDKKREPGTSDYQAFIKAKHERLFNTPPAIIDDAVRKATGSSPIGNERIIKGEANDVHAVKTEDGREIIIRISRSQEAESQFQKERWAIEQCAKAGVPVPRVLYLETLRYEGKPLSISVENRLPGVPLNELAEDMDKKELAELFKKAGAVLSQIHSIKTNGFGELDKDGSGEYRSITGMFSKKELNEEGLLAAAHSASLDPRVIERAMQILQDYQSQYPPIPPRLIHNDFGPKHILVDKSELTGILDFEIAQGGDPIREFARWQFFYEHRYPLQPLEEGYGDKAIFESDFECRFFIWKLHTGLINLSYYVDEGNQSGIGLCKDRLPKDLRYFDGK